MKTTATVSILITSAALCLAATTSVAVEPPLGEWSSECSPAFRVPAMPSAWTFNPAQGPLTVTARLAVDFDLLPSADWVIEADPRSGEPSARLTGYSDLMLEARVVAAGQTEPVARLDGHYATADGARAVTFSWDGRDDAGQVVKEGKYEIEVRGRYIPVWLRLDPVGLRYRDLDGFGDVAEACSRPLRIEVSNLPQKLGDARGQTCAAPPSTYYDSVDASSAATLRATLHNVIDDHTRFPYTSSSTDCWDILNDADENPSNAAQLLDIYKNAAYADGCTSGCTWNREHTWASSFGFSDSESSGPGRFSYTDCHHLRASDAGYNSSRGNKPFNDCTSGCTSKPTDVNNGFGGTGQDNFTSSGGGFTCPNPPPANDLWEVWDHRKGDSARSMLYMDLRYAGDTGAFGVENDLILTDNLSLMTCSASYYSPAHFGVLSPLVAWAIADPPDADEIRRNQQVWCFQQNRNPFVDHPEWVACLYQDQCNALGFGGIGGAADLAPCATTGVQVTWSTPTSWNDGCVSSCSRGFKVYRDGSQIMTGGCAGSLAEAAVSCTDTTGSAGTTYAYSVEAFNDLAETAGGGVSLNAADLAGDGLAPLVSAVTATPTPTSFTATWTTDEAADSYLEWGTSSGVYLSNTSESTMVTSHSLDATGLTESTPYYYRVCSTDACANGPGCSSEATVTTTTAATGCDPGGNTPVFINELHYDNLGTDSGEFIEVAGPAGTDLSVGPWKLELYNGSGAARYTTTNLTGVIDDEGAGFGALSFTYVSNGIQNGSPDGIALIDDTGAVVQFLCYEGTFAAIDGTAVGLTCTDIGVSQTEAPVGTSLQLTGGPAFVYEDFTWTGPTTSSAGSLNVGAGQDMQCDPLPPAPIFADGFESGGTGLWSVAIP